MSHQHSAYIVIDEKENIIYFDNNIHARLDNFEQILLFKIIYNKAVEKHIKSGGSSDEYCVDEACIPSEKVVKNIYAIIESSI